MRQLLFTLILLIFSTIYTSAQSNLEPLFTIDYGIASSISPDENFIITRNEDSMTLWGAWTGDRIWTVDTVVSRMDWNSHSTNIVTDSGEDEFIQVLNLDGEIINVIDCDFPIHNGSHFNWYSQSMIYLRKWTDYVHEVAICSIEDGLVLRTNPEQILAQDGWQSSPAELQTERVEIQTQQFIWLLTDSGMLIDTFNSNGYNFNGSIWRQNTNFPIVLYEVEHPRNGTLYSAAYVFNREGEIVSILEVDYEIVGAEWNSDESSLLTWELEGEVSIWTSGGEWLHQIQNPDSGYGLPTARWSSDNRLFMVYRGNDTNLYVYTTYDAALYRLFPHENPVSGARWNRDGSNILSWSNVPYDCENNCTYQVYLWTTERELITTLPHEDNVSARWLHDDRHILSYSGGNITVWDVETLT